jgi:aspartate aminotransferase
VPEGAGYGLSPYFRVSFATSLDKLKEACRRMDAAARRLA